MPVTVETIYLDRQSNGRWFFITSDGETFKDGWSTKTWNSSKQAVRWLRDKVERSNAKFTTKIGFVVINRVTEHITHLGECVVVPATNGPHRWESRGTQGIYTVWACALCDLQVKRLELYTPPPGDVCAENKR